MSLVIHVQDIRNAGGNLEAKTTLTRDWLAGALSDTELEAPEVCEFTLSYRARLVADDVLVDAGTKLELLVPCSRCNELTPLVIDASFSQLFSTRAPELVEELELTPEDLERETFDGERVELGLLLREFILLEVPMSPACEGGCEDPVVRRILGMDNEGNLKEPEKKPGPLSALGKLADELRISSNDKKKDKN